METGKIMRFDADRGFGFIKPDSGGPDLFMHITELGRNVDPAFIRPGLRVSYDEADGGRGPKAVRVSLLEGYVIQGDLVPRVPELPAQPTTAAWRALWQAASDAAFDRLLDAARANGWVQD